jgi:outer membrane protein assembly factor BamB
VSRGVVYVGYDIQLVALDAATGRKHWDFPLGTPTAPAVRNGTVYASSGDNSTLYAVDADTGRKRWSLKLEGSLSDPAAAAETVFVTSDHYLYAIRA